MDGPAGQLHSTAGRSPFRVGAHLATTRADDATARRGGSCRRSMSLPAATWSAGTRPAAGGEVAFDRRRASREAPSLPVPLEVVHSPLDPAGASLSRNRSADRGQQHTNPFAAGRPEAVRIDVAPLMAGRDRSVRLRRENSARTERERWILRIRRLWSGVGNLPRSYKRRLVACAHWLAMAMLLSLFFVNCFHGSYCLSGPPLWNIPVIVACGLLTHWSRVAILEQGVVSPLSLWHFETVYMLYRTRDSQSAITAWRYLLGALGGYLVAICTVRSCDQRWKDVADTWTFVFTFLYIQSHASRGLINKYKVAAPKAVLHAYEMLLRAYCLAYPDRSEDAVDAVNKHVAGNWEVVIENDGHKIGSQVEWSLVSSGREVFLRRRQFVAERGGCHHDAARIVMRPFYLLYLNKLWPILSAAGLVKPCNLRLSWFSPLRAPHSGPGPGQEQVSGRHPWWKTVLPEPLVLILMRRTPNEAMVTFEGAMHGTAPLMPLDVSASLPNVPGPLSLGRNHASREFDEPRYGRLHREVRHPRDHQDP